ncbi:MAG TPA: D-lyxose/D-mannose family sugar isomerase [Planctomycetota bacterium]|nr:D-lyxose/D-mannose family sugar isomerase [Planctomycetota bacterium]
MMDEVEVKRARIRATAFFEKAGIVMRPDELENIEIVELGLGEFERTGLAIVVYVNTERYCAKEMVLLPGQTCPEHRHPDVAGATGKMETFRCRWGEVYLYVPGEPAETPKAKLPEGSEHCYTVFHEIVLRPGEQYTIASDTLHWFQGGPEGAVVSEFSSRSRDESDVFTDARIQRVPDA